MGFLRTKTPAAEKVACTDYTRIRNAITTSRPESLRLKGNCEMLGEGRATGIQGPHDPESVTL